MTYPLLNLTEIFIGLWGIHQTIIQGFTALVLINITVVTVGFAVRRFLPNEFLF